MPGAEHEIRAVVDNWALWRETGDWERFAIVWQNDVDSSRSPRTCSRARYAPEGPYPELRGAYEEMHYSFGRHFVVDAIAATDPSFPETLAPECRHDCEQRTRATANRAGVSADPR